MHAETLRLANKTIVFSKHDVFEVVVMVTRVKMREERGKN